MSPGDEKSRKKERKGRCKRERERRQNTTQWHRDQSVPCVTTPWVDRRLNLPSHLLRRVVSPPRPTISIPPILSAPLSVREANRLDNSPPSIAAPIPSRQFVHRWIVKAAKGVEDRIHPAA